MSDEPYAPIDCSVHDRLEALATLRRPVTIRYRGSDGDGAVASGRIVDVGARSGAEYLRLDSGLELRLDRIVQVEEDAR
jgi:Rho-binding antiterminator